VRTEFSDSLKPCPFCGAPAQQHRHPKGYLLAGCSDDTCDPGHLAFAVPEKWNSRAQPSQAQQAGVTEAMVEAAKEVFYRNRNYGGPRERVRAALTAALSARQGDGA
jgi:hypothetical protein